jgi:hypothetical protein
MDVNLLPPDLHSDHKLILAPAAFPVAQTNPITGYRTSLYRSGSSSDFLGWIQLLNVDQAAGYIYIRRPGSPPYLGSSRYIVMDLPPELLESILRILLSKEPLQIRFYQGAAAADAAAFIEHRMV